MIIQNMINKKKKVFNFKGEIYNLIAIKVLFILINLLLIILYKLT